MTFKTYGDCWYIMVFFLKKTMKKLDFSFEGEYYIVEEKFVSKDNHKQ